VSTKIGWGNLVLQSFLRANAFKSWKNRSNTSDYNQLSMNQSKLTNTFLSLVVLVGMSNYLEICASFINRDACSLVS